MSCLVTHICSIQNHPIQHLKESDRLMYLSGLGAFLYSITQKEEVHFLFNAWCYSILGYYKEDYGFFNNKGFNTVKNTICIENTWWQFYRVEYTFIFDSFYLLCSQNHVVSKTVYSILKSYYKWNPFYQKRVTVFYKALIKDSLAVIKGLDASFISKLNIDKYHQENLYKKILVVANVSAGKSMLINAITGHQICKSTNMACTSKLHYIYNKQHLDFSVCRTDQQYHILENTDKINSYSYDSIGLNFNSLLAENKICFIDTPGVNNSENSKHRNITEQTIKNDDYNALIYISNCQYFGTTDEHRLLEMIIKHSRKPIIYVLNQLDRFNSKEDSISKMMMDYRNYLLKLGVKDPVIIPMSAYAALLMKLGASHLDEDGVYELETYQRRFSNEYYDLAAYSKQKISPSLLDKTGITLLEETILKIISV